MTKKKKIQVKWGSSSNMWRDPATIAKAKGDGCLSVAVAFATGIAGLLAAGAAQLLS